MVLQSLAQKTEHLKWLKQLRLEEAKRQPLPVAEKPCDCKAWLKAKARQKMSAHKPKPHQAVARDTGLVLLASAPPKQERNHAYNHSFEMGVATWYHVPVESLTQYAHEQINQVGYLALGITRSDLIERTATHLYQILSVQQLPRHMLTVAQSGALKASESMYWLFALGESVPLAQPIVGFPAGFAVKLVTQTEFIDMERF